MVPFGRGWVLDIKLTFCILTNFNCRHIYGVCGCVCVCVCVCVLLRSDVCSLRCVVVCGWYSRYVLCGVRVGLHCAALRRDQILQVRSYYAKYSSTKRGMIVVLAQSRGCKSCKNFTSPQTLAL